MQIMTELEKDQFIKKVKRKIEESQYKFAEYKAKQVIKKAMRND